MTNIKDGENTANRRKRGRPDGISSLPTRERNKVISRAKVKPLDVLMETMAERWTAAQASNDPELRAKLQQEACGVAEKVAPYLHPKLQATTLKGDGGNPVSFVLSLPGADVLRAAIRGDK